MARRGVSIREAARQLGCSRNTIRRYLRDAQARPYAQRAARATKLDSYKAYLQERIKAARPQWIPAVVLLREIRERGYEGGLTQLKAYLAAFKRQEPEPENRYETAPGRQMQADFTHIRRGRDPLIAFVATLGYSRSSAVRFSDNERSDALCEGLCEAFYRFGGVPREVLFDNASTVVVERDAYGEGHHRWHRRLLALAEQFGFTPRLCRPYRARTKGKVERFNGYLKRSFCVPLAASLKQAGLCLDVQAANAYVGRWLSEVADERIHGTTGERPAVRLVADHAALLPLPAPKANGLILPARGAYPVPVESLQHPLSVYNALLEVRP
jgi:Transposase and inactivated derivatives